MWKVSLIPSSPNVLSSLELLFSCFLCCCGGLTSLFSFSLSHQPLAAFSICFFTQLCQIQTLQRPSHVVLLILHHQETSFGGKKRKWDPAMISMSFFTNEQLCVINTPSHNWALGRQTLCMAFLQKEKCFRLTPNEVLMAHAKWLQESIRMVILGKSV